jgi:hypothetical protein
MVIVGPLHFEDLLAERSQATVVFPIVNQASDACLTGSIELVLIQEEAQIVDIDELATAFIAWAFQRETRRIIIHAANIVQQAVRTEFVTAIEQSHRNRQQIVADITISFVLITIRLMSLSTSSTSPEEPLR